MSIQGRAGRSIEAVNDAVTASHLSKREIAARTSIPYSTLMRKLSGHSDFTVRELYLIAEAIQVSPVEFLPPPQKPA